MFATKRFRMAAAALAVVVASGGIAAAVATSASASAKPDHAAGKPAPVGKHHKPRPPKLTLNQFDLNGWVINADYTLGRNTGNTFQQTYTDNTVQGVPIAGPSVGTTFPTEDYVAVPISRTQLYIVWLDPSTYAIVDVFVFNFATHSVYDYAPGSATPQSAGTITIVKRGSNHHW